MSFLKPKDIIQEGDTVVLYLGTKTMHAIEISSTIKNKYDQEIDYVFQTYFGALKVGNLIGVPYGSKLKLPKGWMYVLQPNPELWTGTLPHRTQIMYTPDISMILFQLDIKPGSVVVESGTGSGSLSHYFIRAIKPTGHLHTFDYHKERVEQAKIEFKKHGIQDFVTAYHRDVCKDGFVDDLNGKVDAIFLDLPSPHLVIPHVVKCLKIIGSRFCSFIPCIEQCQKCFETLQANNFTEIQVMEITQIQHMVKTRHIAIMDLEFVKYKKINDDEAIKKEQSREIQPCVTSFAPDSIIGHTGYLIFGTFFGDFTD